MAWIRGNLAYRLLRCISAAHKELPTTVDHYESPQEKLTTHFGHGFFDQIHGKSVIDFGSGEGREAVEIASRGARQVTGVELQERFRHASRELACDHDVEDICDFVESTNERADIVFSLDSFEHFDDPGGILETMSSLVSYDGEVLISFGLPWFHPYGGHLFSVFPWAHLIFSEESLIRWRSDFKTDGATRFHEVAGGLNQMTIARFEKLVANSPLEFCEFRLTPIRVARVLHHEWSREFTTSLIFAKLRLAKVPEAAEVSMLRHRTVPPTS